MEMNEIIIKFFLLCLNDHRQRCVKMFIVTEAKIGEYGCEILLAVGPTVNLLL